MLLLAPPSETAGRSDLARFRVTDRPSVLVTLEQLATARAVVALHPDGGGAPVLSAILEVDGVRLLLDAPAEPALRTAVRGWSKTTLVSSERGVRIEAVLPRLEFDGAAFRTRLPTEILRFQRRDAFRVRTDVGRAPRCFFPGGHLQEARVLDLSTGGIGLALPAALGATIVVGTPVRGCLLSLPEGRDPSTPMAITLVPRRLQPDLGGGRRGGFAFSGLSPVQERAIRSFVLFREREARGTP